MAFHENPDYVRRANEIREQREEEMKKGGRGFGARSDRGWMPPTVKDVEEAKASGR